MTKKSEIKVDSQSKRLSPDSVFRDKDKKLFQTLVVRNAFRHMAARRAVIVSVLGPDYLKEPQQALDKLRVMWKKKLTSLRKAQWQPLLVDKNFTYMKNCPPFGVATDTTSLCCKRPMICPFCFARERVLQPFCKFEAILYGEDATNKNAVLLQPEMFIVSFKSKLARTVKGKQEKIPINIDRKTVHNIMKQTKTVEKNLFHAKYASVLFQAYPAKTELVLTRSGVMLVEQYPSEEAINQYNERQEWSLQIYKASKKNLMKAVSHAFPYPRQVLFTDKADNKDDVLLARFLEMLHGVRMSTWYGPHNKQT